MLVAHIWTGGGYARTADYPAGLAYALGRANQGRPLACISGTNAEEDSSDAVHPGRTRCRQGRAAQRRRTTSQLPTRSEDCPADRFITIDLVTRRTINVASTRCRSAHVHLALQEPLRWVVLFTDTPRADILRRGDVELHLQDSSTQSARGVPLYVRARAAKTVLSYALAANQRQLVRSNVSESPGRPDFGSRCYCFGVPDSSWDVQM